MVVKAELHCFCQSQTCDATGYEPTAWAALTGCGHIFHEGCIKKWFKRSKNSKCPNCAHDNNVHARIGHAKRHHPVQRLWLELDQHSLLSSQPNNVPASDDDLAANSDSDADYSDRPDARGQLRETLNTLRDVRLERDHLRDRVPALEANQRALEEDLQNAQEAEADLHQQIADLERQVARLEDGLPIEELAAANAKLEAAAARAAALEVALAAERAAQTEAEDNWRKKRIEWKEEKSRYLAQINTSGNAGAKHIKQLKKELDDEQRDKLQVQARLDRVGMLAEEEAAKVAEAHAEALRAAKDARDRAILNARQLKEREDSMLHENERLRRALANYEARDQKRREKQPRRTPTPPPQPQPHHTALFSPRKALVGPHGLVSPRKPPPSPRVARPPPSSETDGEPGTFVSVTMNGVKRPGKRAAAVLEVADSEDDCVVDTPEEEDDEVVILSSDGEGEAPRPTPAFSTLAPPPKKLWTAKVKKSTNVLGQDKYLPDPKSSAARATGPRVRPKVGRR